MIFLGAGASAPFNIPTTTKLTEDMRSLLAAHVKLLEEIDDFFEFTYDRKPNYENILTILSDLGTPERKSRFYDGFINRFPEYKGKKLNFDEIIDEMYNQIIQYCTSFISGEQAFNPEKLEEVFRETYDLLFAVCPMEMVFTTNYDPSLKLWCQKRNIMLYDRTQNTQNPEIKTVTGDLHLPTDIRAHDGQSPAVGLIRLHGSVWVYNTTGNKMVKIQRTVDRLLFSDLYPFLVNKKPVMIFPGQEESLSRGQWDPLYQFFKSNLKRRCTVIGYSFRDEVINRVFIDNLVAGKIGQILIINPRSQEAKSNLLYGQTISPNEEGRIVTVEGEFGDRNLIDPLIYHFEKTKDIVEARMKQMRSNAKKRLNLIASDQRYRV